MSLTMSQDQQGSEQHLFIEIQDVVHKFLPYIVNTARDEGLDGHVAVNLKKDMQIGIKFARVSPQQ